MAISFDDTGIVIDSEQQIRDKIGERAKTLLAPFSGESEVKVDDSSVIGRLNAVIAKPISQNTELLPVIMNQFDINSAQGLQLDNLLWQIHRIKRKGISQAEGTVMLFGDVSTVIANNSEVGNIKTGDTFSTNEQVILNSNDCNGVEIAIASVSGTYELNYSINGYLSQSPNVVVSVVNETTVQEVADRLVDAINSQTSGLTASRNNDNSVKVIITDQNNTGDFSTTGQMGIVRVYKPVRVTSTTYGADESQPNTITQIRTSTLGWRGVTNPFFIDSSQEVEKDEDYRYRGNMIKGFSNTSSRNSINARLNSLKGVSFLNVRSNQDGLHIVVQGGNEDEIAVAISDVVADGIMTNGDIVREVSDINGGKMQIAFSRPNTVALTISMALTIYPNFPSNGKNLIKQAIVDWFNTLQVGEDVYYSRLYEPINSVNGFSVRNLKVGKLGGTLATEDVILAFNEVATISAENIQIGGS